MNYTVEYPGGVPRGLEDWLLWKTCTFGIRSTLNTVYSIFLYQAAIQKCFSGFCEQWEQITEPEDGVVGPPDL